MEARQVISVERARSYYPQGDSVHGFDHVLRVLSLVRRIGPAEGADMEVLEAAALLHDVARGDEEGGAKDHAALGAQRARQILADQPADKLEAVCEAIRTHRFRNNIAPLTQEGRILYDADKLDAIGAIGVARAYAMGGQYGQALWSDVPADYVERDKQMTRRDASSGEHTPVHEFHFKLGRLKDTLFTRTAKRLADDRHRFMVEFFGRLDAEVKGEL